MESQPFTPRRGLYRGALLILGFSQALADNHVTVNAWASPEYVSRKDAGGASRQETYVFAAGRFFGGSRVDHSIDRLPFRKIAEFLAPELARRNYVPTPRVDTADLLLIVHWGTTAPRITLDQTRGTTDFSIDHAEERAIQQQFNETMAGGDAQVAALFSTGSDIDAKTSFEQSERLTDDLDSDLRAGNNAQLLGYTQDMRRFEKNAFQTVQEATLRANLEEERYFIIIKAYDFHEKKSPGQRQRPVWTLYLNMRSPGQNFKTAMTRMSAVAVDYFGRASDGIKVGRPTDREGTVNLGPLIILGEVK
ncbi:MAG TPA: hypothetical protein VGM64_20245 [Lacunisphaera sp.]|jgi:hypothetical protein